jgi:hypothetical protein
MGGCLFSYLGKTGCPREKASELPCPAAEVAMGFKLPNGSEYTGFTPTEVQAQVKTVETNWWYT